MSEAADALELLKKIVGLPAHTGSTAIIGGIRPDDSKDPNYWKGPREVWLCPKDCPACAREAKYK